MKTNQFYLFFAGLLLALLITLPNAAFAQVKVGSNPTTIGSSSNLEVEATGGQKVIVNKADGSVIIQNTPTGNSTDKMLTVDGSGNVRAVQPPSLNPTNVYVFAKQSTNQVLANQPNLTIGTKVNMTNEVADTHNAWDVSTSTFTAPEDGYYNIQFSFNLEYDCSSIYGQPGYVAVGITKSAGTYTGAASTNNGSYRSYFQGNDNNTTGSLQISPNPGGGVLALTLYFKTGEQLICTASQGNSNGVSLSSTCAGTNGGAVGSLVNFISITKM